MQNPSNVQFNIYCREPGTAERLLEADAQLLREHGVMLHHPAQGPFGAIGPARALLPPMQHAGGAAAPAAESTAGGQAQRAALEAPLRLWLWLHPAAYHEALAMLQRLCRQPVTGSSPPPDRPDAGSPAGQDVPGQVPQQSNASVIQQPQQPAAALPRSPPAPQGQPPQQRQPSAAPGTGISITLLAPHLRRLELRGPSSTAALAGLLPDFTALTCPPAPDGVIARRLLMSG